jgi:hypothetical protein
LLKVDSEKWVLKLLTQWFRKFITTQLIFKNVIPMVQENLSLPNLLKRYFIEKWCGEEIIKPKVKNGKSKFGKTNFNKTEKMKTEFRKPKPKEIIFKILLTI